MNVSLQELLSPFFPLTLLLLPGSRQPPGHDTQFHRKCSPGTCESPLTSPTISPLQLDPSPNPVFFPLHSCPSIHSLCIQHLPSTFSCLSPDNDLLTGPRHQLLPLCHPFPAQQPTVMTIPTNIDHCWISDALAGHSAHPGEQNGCLSLRCLYSSKREMDDKQ